jgi:diacylglycerol kinase
MTHFHLFNSGDQRRAMDSPAEPVSSASSPEIEAFAADELEGDGQPRPRQTTRNKLLSGYQGIRHALRAESSYFAHGYRGLLIALSAVIIGLGPLEWCLLAISAALVLGSELFHSCIARFARSPFLEGDKHVAAACEIAAGAVVVASLMSGAITLTVLIAHIGILLGWWR